MAMEAYHVYTDSSDWSPRISFSHNLASRERICSRPRENYTIPDVGFEFLGSDLLFEQRMLSADELFCDGKLRPLASESDPNARSCETNHLPKSELRFLSPRNDMGFAHHHKLAIKTSHPQQKCKVPSSFVPPSKCESDLGSNNRPTMPVSSTMSSSDMKQFTKNPRCSSMTSTHVPHRPLVDNNNGTTHNNNSMFNNNRRSCVSLGNSRCPSPPRSFSLPSTAPTSPTSSSRSICPPSSLSSSSSSSSTSSSLSKYGKVMEFLRLKKLHSSSKDPSSSLDNITSRLSISPRYFWPFHKNKTNLSSSLITLESIPSKDPHQATCGTKDKDSESHGTKVVHDGTYLTSRDFGYPKVSSQPSNILSKKSSSLITSQSPSSNSQLPHLVNRASSSPVPQSNTSPWKSSDNQAPPLQQNVRFISHDKHLSMNDPTMLVVDDRIWDFSGGHSKKNVINNNNGVSNIQTTHAHYSINQGKLAQKPKNVNRSNVTPMASTRTIARSKALERPISYASSVRVTPVLNVPGCMTPSLRKNKPPSKSKSISFGNLFAARENIPMAYTMIPSNYKPS